MVNMRELFAFDRISNQEMERVPLTDRERSECLLEEGDLLFARQSLVREGAGRVVYVDQGPERTWEGHVIRVRLDRSRALPRYFFYYFRSPQGRAEIETIVEQVAAAGIRGSDLARLGVPLPSLSCQEAVAEVLGALDDKIQCNASVAELLETRLAALFGALGFDEGGGGRVTLDQLVEVNPYRAKPKGDRASYIDMAALPTDSALVAAPGVRAPKSGMRFINGDTVMARITPCLENGKTAYIDCLPAAEVGIGSTEFIVLRPKGGVPVQFGYFLARSRRFRDFAVRHMSGSTGRQRCPAEALAKYELRPPAHEAAAKFAMDADPAFAMMRGFLNESLKLAELRDTLLPRLLSGELRVRDAEALVGEAV